MPSVRSMRAFLLMLSVAGCGDEPPRSAPAQAAPAPVASAPAAPSVPDCTVVVPGGVLVQSAGVHPRVAVGEGAALVAFEPPSRRVTGSIRYDWAHLARVLPLPLSADTASRGGVSGGRGDPAEEESIAYLPAVLGTEAIGLDCGRNVASGTSARCRLFTAAGDELAPDLALPNGWSDSLAALDATASGTTLFVAALADSRRALVAWVVRRGAEPVRVVLGSRLALEGDATEARLEVHASSEDEATIALIEPSGRTRLAAIDGQGRVTAELAEGAVVPAAFEVRPTEVEGAPHLLGYVDGAPVPLLGLDPEAHTRSPSLLEAGGSHVLVFVEGEGTAARVHAARLDRTTHAVVGPTLELSTRGRVGSAHASAYGGRIVVTWDELVNGTWDVRATELSCP